MLTGGPPPFEIFGYSKFYYLLGSGKTIFVTVPTAIVRRPGYNI